MGLGQFVCVCGGGGTGGSDSTCGVGGGGERHGLTKVPLCFDPPAGITR